MRVVLDEVAFAYPGSRRLLFEKLTAALVAGRTYAIVGPSGSGKSTLLDILGALRAPTAGTVSVMAEGRSDAASPLTRALSSWVLQSNIVLAGRSVRDNVAIGAILRGASRADAIEAARKRLEELGLADKAEQSVNILSGGEVQRVTIARCLLEETAMILADEPTGNLDRANTARVGERSVPPREATGSWSSRPTTSTSRRRAITSSR